MQQITPTVSIAAITYNMQQYLPQLLDSILMQKTNFSFEIVVDDDHSPDQSRTILLDYQRRFPDRIVLSLRDRNVSGSLNMYGVLRQCRGKYVAILEGDDWWECEDKLQYQYDFLESHPEYIAMYCNSWVETSLTETIHHPRRDISSPLVFTYADYMHSHFLDRLTNSTDTAFFRNFFKDAPEQELDVFYRAHNMVWDQSLALILYGKGPVYVDPRLVSHHRSIVAEEAQITSLCMPNETIKSVTHGCTPVRKTTLSTSYTAAAHGFIRSVVCCSQRLSVLHVKARVKMIGKKYTRFGVNDAKSGHWYSGLSFGGGALSGGGLQVY